MDLTENVVTQKAKEYRVEEPLFTVEQEQMESLPRVFRSGDFGWRDAEWIVQWYYRRHLGAYPNQERRKMEDAYKQNDFGQIQDVIGRVLNTSKVTQHLETVCELKGVDIELGTAFLFFILPEEYMVYSDRNWQFLSQRMDLTAQENTSLTMESYQLFNETCERLCDAFDCGNWTLYRALWRLSAEQT